MKVLVTGYKGYIGFALTMRLLKEGHKVVGVDNNQRINAVKERGSVSATGNRSPLKYDDVLGLQGDFEGHMFDVALDPDHLNQLVSKFEPDVLFNLAHNPSAPYSQIDQDHANFTITNNINGTNNLLWSIKKHCPDCHYITIGSTGEYSHYANIDIEEGYFSFMHKGRQSAECLFPRRPGSIYHTSKVASTYLIDLLARDWKLKCTDVMQSVVFGIYTDECDKVNEYTRLDSDDCFGTVINRFCIQALLGEPLTIFGEGKHQRGFIAINDSVQALMLAMNNPAEVGKVQTWNQLSEWHSINDIAEMVIKVAKELGLTIDIKHIPTPRTEHTGDHYYNYVSDNLKGLGYKPTRTIEQEIKYILEHVHAWDEKTLNTLRSVIMPSVKWNFK